MFAQMKNPHIRRSAPAGRSQRARRGMTLIEVIFSCGILTVILLYALLTLMSLVRLNRLTAIEITTSNAMRSQIEEVMTAARDNVSEDGVGNQSKAVLHYYGSMFENEKVALGKNGDEIFRVDLAGDGSTLTYHFAVPEPGESARVLSSGANHGKVAMSQRGVGRMTIYLTEPDVPPLSAYPEFDFMWTDLGDATPEDTGPDKGFDMNRDGIIDNKKLDGNPRPDITVALLKDASNLDKELDIRHLPIDITITYFTNAKHEREEYTMTRRMIVM